MLAIRLQRTGRSGHAQFRVIVQDARRSPKSGDIVHLLGSYNPHTKAAAIDKEKAAFYLEHGAQPSDRVALLLKSEGVKLPNWVKAGSAKQSAVRNPEKRRSTRPDEPETPEAPAEEPAAEASEEVPAEAAPETPKEEATAEEPAAEAETKADEDTKPEA